MIFSSAEYPVFLIAVFGIYLLIRFRGWPGALARLAALLLLGDLVYLLLSKDVSTLCDPVGGLLFRLLAADAPPLRHPLVYLAGTGILAGALFAGLRLGGRLESARGGRVTAHLAWLVVGGLGVAVWATWRAGVLEELSRAFSRGGHLVYLALLGLALGASLREDGRRFGRLLVLFLVSAIFYHAWAASQAGAYKYLLFVILGTITLDYFLALWIHAARGAAARGVLLVVSLVSNLGVLALFKYFDFFLASAKGVAGWAGLSLDVAPFALILPAGISFHTFQSLSYTIDVYKRKIAPTRSILEFATFVLFFPQLVAGPIVRAHELLPQLAAEPALSDRKGAEGLYRILLGLGKKVILADFLATALVDRVFATPTLFSGVEVLAGVYAYALQIYLDFSAYSDIAIGSALLLGFEFPENFRTPYRSASIQEFWRRWHITLSSWLRDYLYIALGGSRGAPWRTYVNLAITMLLGGLWHGANWTFIVWGGLHGGGLAVTRYWQRLAEESLPRARRLLGVMLALAVAGVVAHVELAPQVRWAAGQLHLGAAWLHLVLAWLYLTPAWAAGTAWLGAASPPAMHGAPSPGWRSAARPARLAFLAMSAVLLLAVKGGLPPWIWPVLLAWAGLACLADVAEAAPDARAARAWLVYAARRGLAILLTFHYVCFAWVFFRATSFEKGRQVLAQIGGIASGATDAVNLLPPTILALLVGGFAHFFPPATFRWLRERFVELPPWAQGLVLAAAALVLREFARPIVVPFIYFQF